MSAVKEESARNMKKAKKKRTNLFHFFYMFNM